MEDEFKSLFDPHTGIEWTMCICVALLILALIVLIIYGVLCLIDYAWLPKIEGYGIIQKKVFRRAYSSSSYNQITKMIDTTYHPDAWCVIVEVEGRSDSFFISESDYLRAEINKRVSATYKVGRLFKNSLYIKSVSI